LIEDKYYSFRRERGFGDIGYFFSREYCGAAGSRRIHFQVFLAFGRNRELTCYRDRIIGKKY